MVTVRKFSWMAFFMFALLVLLLAKCARPASAYTNTICRDPSEAIRSSSSKEYTVCTAFSVKGASPTVLHLKMGTDAVLKDFQASPTITLLKNDSEYKYNLAMTRVVDSTFGSYPYNEDGIYLYHTLAAGQYLMLWYVIDDQFNCDLLYPSRILVNGATFELCGGVFLIHQREDNFRGWMKAPMIELEMFGIPQGGTFLWQWKNASGWHSEVYERTTQVQVPADQFEQATSGEGLYLYHQDADGEPVFITHYENVGPAFKYFLPITLSGKAPKPAIVETPGYTVYAEVIR